MPDKKKSSVHFFIFHETVENIEFCYVFLMMTKIFKKAQKLLLEHVEKLKESEDECLLKKTINIVKERINTGEGIVKELDINTIPLINYGKTDGGKKIAKILEAIKKRKRLNGKNGKVKRIFFNYKQN